MRGEAGAGFLRYSSARFARELERIHLCFEQISEDEAWWHPAEGSNSIGNIVVHLCGNIGQWMGSVANGSTDIRDRHSEFVDRPSIKKAELLARIDKAVETASSAVRNMNAAKLTDTIVIQDFHVSCLEAIYETERHFAEHVGQIVYIAKLKRGKAWKPLWVPKTPAQGA